MRLRGARPLEDESFGYGSKVVPRTSTVRHSESPHTEQQRLLPTLASSHSSIGLPAIQMRFDAEGSRANKDWSSSRISRCGSRPSGRRLCSRVCTACSTSCCVAAHRSQVLPPLTSLCHTIGSCLMTRLASLVASVALAPLGAGRSPCRVGRPGRGRRGWFRAGRRLRRRSRRVRRLGCRGSGTPSRR